MGINPCTATCPTAPDPTSLPRRALALPHAPRLRPRLPAQEGSDAAMCYTALNPPPCSGGLRCCHVPHGSGPCLPTLEGFGGATCPTAPDHAFLLGRAPTLSRVLRPSKKGLAGLPMRLGVRPKNLQTFKIVSIQIKPCFKSKIQIDQFINSKTSLFNRAKSPPQPTKHLLSTRVDSLFQLLFSSQRRPSPSPLSPSLPPSPSDST
jgi:hypothetical protein